MDGKNRVKKLINKLWKTDKIRADTDFYKNYGFFKDDVKSDLSYIKLCLFVEIHTLLLIKLKSCV